MGMDVTKVLQFSLHEYSKTLQLHVDHVETAWEKTTDLVAQHYKGISSEPAEPSESMVLG